MSDYAKTVKQLRYCSKATVKDCMECEGYKETGDCVSEKLAKDAAAAIEALQAELDKYHELCDVDEIPEVLEILMTV